MRDLLIVMIVSAMVPMAFTRPIIGLLLWIGFSYMNPHRLAFGFAYSYPWVQLAAIVTLISFFMHPDQRKPIPGKPIVVLMLAFLFWTCISTMTAVKVGDVWAHWTDLLKINILALVTLALVTDKQKLHLVLWAVVLSFGFWGFKGGLFTILSGGGNRVFGPPRSFFYDNNDFALVMCMVVPLMRYLQLTTANKWISRALSVLMVLTVVSIIGTYSRGGFLALLAMSLLLIFKSRRRFPLIVLATIVAVGAASLVQEKWVTRMSTIQTYEEDGSAMGRIESWQFATSVALARPFTGAGFNVWASDELWDRYGPPGATHRAIHSIYFDVLGAHGFVGLAIYLVLIITGWASLSRIRRQSRAGPADAGWMGDLASMIQVSMVGFLVAGAFSTVAYLELFIYLFALTVILQRMIAEEQQQIFEPDPPGTADGAGPGKYGFATARPKLPSGGQSSGSRGSPRW